MSKAYLNKYENGKSQTNHARDRANGVMHQSRLREYLDNVGHSSDASPVVITVPPTATPSKKTMAQMTLFDQPVTVSLAESPALDSRQASSPAPNTARQPWRTVALSAAKHKPTDAFTLRGMLKGCGLGLATAAAVLLAYLVVT